MEVAGKRLNTDIPSTENETKLCESCEVESLKTQADGVCRECNEQMCNTCFKHHLKGKLCRNHMLLSHDDFSSLSLGSRSQDVTKCENHDNEVVKFYCRSHDVVGCGDCIVLEHTSCKPEYIKDLAKTFKCGDMYKTVVKRVEDLEAKKISYVRNNENKTGELKRMNEKALKEIRQFRAEINKCLDDSEADLLNKLQKVTQKNTETQTKIEKRLEKLSSELEKVKQMLNAQLHSENSLFINAVTCKSKLFDIEKMYENKEQDCVLLTFDFVRNEHMSGLLKSEGPIGSLKIDKKTKQKHFVIGVRVRRGPDWKYRDQDGGGPGTLVGFESNGWANVKWDNGYINNYRVGQENSFDLEII